MNIFNEISLDTGFSAWKTKAVRKARSMNNCGAVMLSWHDENGQMQSISVPSSVVSGAVIAHFREA